MRMFARLFAVIAVLFAAFAANAADIKIKEVKVRSLNQIGGDDNDVLSHSSLSVGDQMSQMDLSQVIAKDVKTLLDTKRYAYVGAEIIDLDNEGGKRINYVIRRRHRFAGPLIVKGNEHLKSSKIAKLSELKDGDFIDEPILVERAANIRKKYIKEYFPDVSIVTEIIPLEGKPAYANVSFTIKEGERAKIKDYVFRNNLSIEEKDLRTSFGKYPWYDPRGWFTDTPISAQDLEEARRAAEEVYHNRGYLDARVAPPVREALGDEKVNIVFNVSEGDLYTVESVDVKGITKFPESQVRAAAKIKADDVAGAADIEASAKGIRDFYGSRGYADCVVDTKPITIAGKPGRMAITYNVEEGPVVYVRDIIIRGNDKTKSKVIRREVMMSPGSKMDTVRIEQNERRLKNMGYFSDVRHYTENEDEKGARDLVYEVDEQRTGNFMVGVGLSSVDNVVGFLEISQNNFDILNWPNFTGGGQKARLGVEVGSRRQTVEVQWSEPWLFDKPLRLDVDLYRRMRWYDEYDEIRTGGAVGLSYPMQEIDIFGYKLAGRVGMRYTLEQVQMDDVEKGWGYDADGDELEFGDDDRWDADKGYFRWQEDKYGDNLNSIFRLYWSEDKRNHPFFPTRGYQATIFGDASEGGVGDNEFYKVGANYKHWFELPWYKHVFSVRGRIETVDAYNGDLPVYERLFLGGPRSIRGVEYRDIGPKVHRESGHRHAAIGGQTLAMASFEYTIPVFKAVRFATFFDIGSLGEDEFDADFSKYSASVGVGLRIDIPGFPIRLDFAKPVHDDDDYTDEEIFSFLIGFE